MSPLALIAHKGCGFYREWLRLPPERIEEQQLSDLRSARTRIRQVIPGLEVHCFWARRQDGQVDFFGVD